MAATATTCRYCGEAPHVPADSCLTASEKAGLMFGKVMIFSLVLLVVVGTIAWLGMTYS
jgi:hypothetical protein